MANYSNELKQAMVAKLCSPNGPSFNKLSRETGISPITLKTWVSKFGDITEMENKPKKIWSASEKHEIIIKSKSMSEAELGGFLRQNGLHHADLKEWEADILKALETKMPGRPKKDPKLVKLERENKNLKKDLLRKDRALAEQTALVILKKKAQALWGDDEEEN